MISLSIESRGAQIRPCVPPPAGGGKGHSTVPRILGLAREASRVTVGGGLPPAAVSRQRQRPRGACAAIPPGALAEMWNLRRNLVGSAHALAPGSARHTLDAAPPRWRAPEAADSVDKVTPRRNLVTPGGGDAAAGRGGAAKRPPLRSAWGQHRPAGRPMSVCGIGHAPRPRAGTPPPPRLFRPGCGLRNLWWWPPRAAGPRRSTPSDGGVWWGG